jgi:hypothetical protein
MVGKTETIPQRHVPTASCPRFDKSHDNAGISQLISASNGLSTSVGPGFNHLFGFNAEKKKPAPPRRTGGAESKERIPKGFTSLGKSANAAHLSPH